MAYKGKYIVENVNKYDGDPTKVTYRSLWERRVMRYLDHNTNIISWNSEEVIVPYYSPVDGRMHRYFTDFFIITSKGDKILIEVKPKAQVEPPKVPKRKTRKYYKSLERYVINQAKWKAAREYCLKRGWKFKILTENEIFGKKNGKKNR